MTRPTILDLDLVVVPREANKAMMPHTHAGRRSYTAMLSASPYPTAWDDVRTAYDTLSERLAVVDKEACNGRVIIGRQKTLMLEAAEVLNQTTARAEAAEARIAELEKRLADAERVIEPKPLNAVAWQWRSRVKGGAWDAGESGRYGQPTPPFMEVEERQLVSATEAGDVISDLEKKLANAEEIIRPFSDATESLDGNERENSDIWENGAAMAITFGHLRAARAYMEGK